MNTTLPRTSTGRRRAAAVAAVGLALTTLVSCSSDAKPSSPDESELTAQTPEAQGPVDKITWNLPAGEPASLDYSYTWDAASGNVVLANLCDSLMRQQPDGSITPSLAESVSTPDAKTYVYTIREGVTFTDGSPLTADDVAYSLNRQLDPATGSYWAGWFQNVKSVEVTAPGEVTVSMSQPDVMFGAMMTTPAGAVVKQDVVEAQGDKYGTPAGGVMCSGPYALEQWNTGRDILVRANPDYWDEELTPQVESIEFTFVREASAITNGLMTGSIDGTWAAPISSYGQLSRAPGGTLYANESTLVGYLQMVSFDGPLGEVKVRQALQKVVDYDGIVESVLNGAAKPAKAAATPASWGYEQETFAAGYEELPGAEQDLEGAEALLEEAGVPDAPVVIAFDAGDQTASRVMASIQDTAGSAGLKVELKPLPTAEFGLLFFDPKARDGIDAFFNTSSLDVPDPLELFLQQTPDSGYNYSGFENPGFTDPVMEARGEQDPQKRAELLVAAQASAAEIVQIVLPLYSPYELLFLNDRVTGAPVSSLAARYYPWAATLGAP